MIQKKQKLEPQQQQQQQERQKYKYVLLPAYGKPTLSYRLFVHRNELKKRGFGFNRKLCLTRSKMIVTDKLTSLKSRNQAALRHNNPTEFDILEREQVYSLRLKRALYHMMCWQIMTPTERKEVVEETKRKFIEEQERAAASMVRRRLDYNGERTSGVEEVEDEEQEQRSPILGSSKRRKLNRNGMWTRGAEEQQQQRTTKKSGFRFGTHLIDLTDEADGL